MKLLPRYATACGLDVRRQWVLESFYPLPVTRYVTLHASSGMAAKNYPLYAEVLRLILPILNSQRIQVVQLGGANDPALQGCVHLQGKTSFHQSSYILRNSMLHLGNDSWLAHRAGELNVPLITLFGPTTAANHGAYSYDAAKTAFIESHRWGRQPTFAPQEQPMSIALIPPEHVANEALRLLGIADRFTHSSRFWGQLFQHTILDLIPDSIPAPGFLPQSVINVRMDYLHDEVVLAQVLATGRRINLITARPISQPDLLAQHRGQILSYNHELGARAEDGSPCPEAHYPSADYVMAIKGLFPQHAFFTKETDTAVLAQLRFRYLDVCLVEQTKDTTQADYLAAALGYLNREDSAQNRLDLCSESTYHGSNGGSLRFRSNKAILSRGVAYGSLAHLAAKQPMQTLGEEQQVIDSPLFWKDMAHYAILYHPATSHEQA